MFDKYVKDQRGAILVLGIMLGAFLVGALFYLVGVGHAVMWREAVQDAADATAYEATVWQSRGMNVVVAINIFMAIVMGILIAWRLALLFVTLLVAVSAIACVASVFIPVLAPACSAAGYAGRLLGRMAARDPKVQDKIYKTLGVLHMGQAVVSSAGPILSVARSSIENSQRPNVKFAVALGPQLLPSPILDTLALAGVAGGSAGLVEEEGGGGGLRKKGGNNGNNGNGNNGNGNNGNGNNGNGGKSCSNNNNKGKDSKTRKPRKAKPLMGKPYSLSAEESDDIDTFCKKASDKMGDPFKILALEAANVDGASAAGNSGGGMGALFSFLTKGMAGYFCGQIGPGMVDGVVDTQAGDACKNADVAKNYDSKKKKGETAEQACKRELKKASDDARKAEGDKKGGGGGKRKNSGGGGGGDLAWADVWGPMANGNMFGQTWSIIRAERDHSQIDKAIEIAGSFGGGGSGMEEDEDGATVFAQSEMFFDCESDWDSCYPTSAWTMNWRARLRRVHSPLDLAMTGIEKTVSERFSQIVSEPPIQKVVGGTPLAQFFEDPSGSILPASLKDPLEAMRDEVASQGGEAAQWVKEQSADRVSIIH